ncbi:MAG: hypothetical protein HC867_03465 [Bacteroidia bacterium]|nr:hypothetical protein [Bacteroidia bacterium]
MEVHLFSKRGYGNLVVQLYTAEVNKSAELKKIEALIKDIRQAKKILRMHLRISKKTITAIIPRHIQSPVI